MFNFLKRHKILFGILVAVILILVINGNRDKDDNSNGPAQSGAWARFDNNPIIVPGFPAVPGGPRGVNIADPSVIYDQEENKWKMWFATGWDEQGSPRIVIRYAESADAKTWNILPTPALDRPGDSGAWDYTNVETPAVIKNPSAPKERRYTLWYSGGNTKERAIDGHFPYYQVGVAFSEDGKRFTRLPASESPFGKPGLSFTVKDAFPAFPKATDGVAADPEIVLKDGTFHMWFSSIGMDQKGAGVIAGISHATSQDGIRWTASNKNALQSLWGNNPGETQQPSVLWNHKLGQFEMWFTNDSEKDKEKLPAAADGATGYWHAVSKDGEQWTISPAKERDFNWDKKFPSEEFGLVTGVEVVLKNDTYYMFYNAYGSKSVPSGWDAPAVWAMNLATKKTVSD